MIDQTIGLVGLGAMGRGVANNLVTKGFKLVAYDVRPEVKDWVEALGAAFAPSLTELGRQCGIVISFVVNDTQTEQILFGDGGLTESMKPDSIFIACSTMPPAYVASLDARLAAHSIRLLDAPVTGGAAGAAKGSLTVMAAGPKQVFEQSKPALEAFGARIYYMGEKPGAGAQVKVINQLLCGVHLAAAGEALALAKRQGLPLDITRELLCSGSANSWMLADRGPRMTDEAFGDVTSAVDIFVKDMGLVLDAARTCKFSAPLASAAYNAFLSVSGSGMGTWDDSAVMCDYPKEPYQGEIPLPVKHSK